MSDEFLERWLEDVVATPGLTAIRNLDHARAALVEDALRALPLVDASAGAVVDVGSGGGSPGIPLAAVRPAREFTLLDAARRKCDFLERASRELPNVRVVWGRAEEQSPESFGLTLAKALAKPPVAIELCLPLLRVGGMAILWVGRNASLGSLDRSVMLLGGDFEPSHVPGLLTVRKVSSTPAAFPRRPGMAKKRPLV